jgi:hypothetical protein
MPKTETEKPSYPILIADYNSAGIRAAAKAAGITHMRRMAVAHPTDQPDTADNAIVVYALPDPKFPGLEIMVADTNADPVWREQDESDWAELMESIGLTPEAQPAAPTRANAEQGGHTLGANKCYRCGGSWAIVNACGCDPDNLPTRPVSATPTPWASGERINGDKSGIYTVAYETAHPQKVATVNDPNDVPYIVRAMNSHADLLAACEAADRLVRAVREHTGASGADKLTRENYALAYARVRIGGVKAARSTVEALKISEEEAWAGLEKRTA